MSVLNPVRESVPKEVQDQKLKVVTPQLSLSKISFCKGGGALVDFNLKINIIFIVFTHKVVQWLVYKPGNYVLKTGHVRALRGLVDLVLSLGSACACVC